MVKLTLQLGEEMRQAILEMARRHAIVGEVRCIGLFAGVELVTDRTTREGITRAPDALVALRRSLLDDGVYLYIRGDTVLIAPPLIATEAEVRRGVEALDRGLARAAERLASRV